ncbi:VOC family protein [Streptomyces sp. CC208A]|uniref:VOC family protein n=1 Tax=Streptomyces sp. CC208A TaxID=3044573 RepID=UPI0024A9B809|nr:VOC family protein [Streptomyces sp. CC208A]
MAAIKEFQVTIDCADPVRLAAFWCEVLGYVMPDAPEDEKPQYFACSDPSGKGPRVLFQRVPEGKVVKNRVHLDVRAGTGLVGEERLAVLKAECERLVALGAVCDRVLLADEENESCINMRDIEGNEFCLD